MELKEFEGYGRKIVVEFKCRRCGVTATRPLKECLPSDGPMQGLYDLLAPKGWHNGGFYYPLFCPDCGKKYYEFINGEDLKDG